MVQETELEEMSRADITKIAPETLPDLLDVEITGETPAERLENYLSQAANPYCFRVGKTPVKVSFARSETPLEEKLKQHFSRLKGQDFGPSAV